MPVNIGAREDDSRGSVASSRNGWRDGCRKSRTGRKIFAFLAILVGLDCVAIAGYVFYLGKTFDDKTEKFEQDEVFSGE